MGPEVEAAIIAAGVGILTLIGAVYGTRKTSQDTKNAVKDQLTEQGVQLDKTLEAQSDQLERTLAEQRTRTWNERFATAAGQLGSDKATIRLAGVYAMAGLADEWEENRQACVDVLCGYLRMPYEPGPGAEAPTEERLAFEASREVRHTVIRVITARLKEDADPSWQGLNYDFTGVVFDGGDFMGAKFSSGVIFRGAKFSGLVSFIGVEFSGDKVRLKGPVYSGGMVDFSDTAFCGDEVDFTSAKFSGLVTFQGAQFSRGTVNFRAAEFSGGIFSFLSAKFSGDMVCFSQAKFPVGTVDFTGTEFSGGEVDFTMAEFSGSEVDFRSAEFSGSTVDFSYAGDWSVPPAFPSTDTPPPGVKLPSKRDRSQV